MEDKNRKVFAFRLPQPIVRELDEVARFNSKTRTDEVERYIREGLERSQKNAKARFYSFSIMVLTLASTSLYIIYLLGI